MHLHWRLLGCLFLLFSLLSDSTHSANKLVADFAIYNTPYDLSVDGVWKPEVEALKKMLRLYGWTYREVGAEDIISGFLGEGGSLNFRGLIMPGGYSVPRQWAIGPVGKLRIETFVKSGGSYIGFCAGSYYASQEVDWAEESIDPKAQLNLIRDYRSYHNDWSPDLLPGRAIGPVQWVPWKIRGDRSAATGLAPVEINLRIPAMKTIGMPPRTHLFYLGGPFFQLAEDRKPRDLEIWAKTIGPSQVMAQDMESDVRLLGESQPTVIKYGLEKGKVILFSYHPVILLGGKIDGVQVEEEVQLRKPVSNSNPAPLTLNETNYQSWNILYAALTVASGRQLKPMPRPQHL